MRTGRPLDAESLASALAALRLGRPPLAEPLASVMADLRRANVDALNKEAMTETFERFERMTQDDRIELINSIERIHTEVLKEALKQYRKRLKQGGDDPITVLNAIEASIPEDTLTLLKSIEAIPEDNLIFKHFARLYLLHQMEPGTADRRWTLLWDGVDVVLPELVSLAKIQPAQYRGFCLAVHDRLLEFIDWDWSAANDDYLLKAEKHLRAAQDAILALSEGQRHYVSIAMQGFPANDEWSHAIPKVLEGIAKITGSAPYRANEPTKRGPKRKRSHLLEFRRFGKDLWRIARDHGGDFKVWVDPKDDPKKHDARGSMAEALRLVEPVLPPELVPKIISAKMLNLLKP
jgi:hypothetical protein